jgi:hypothetical protein
MMRLAAARGPAAADGRRSETRANFLTPERVGCRSYKYTVKVQGQGGHESQRYREE